MVFRGMHTPHFPYPLPFQWTLRLTASVGGCEQSQNALTAELMGDITGAFGFGHLIAFWNHLSQRGRPSFNASNASGFNNGNKNILAHADPCALKAAQWQKAALRGSFHQLGSGVAKPQGVCLWEVHLFL
jgi:hypothetical protein